MVNYCGLKINLPLNFRTSNSLITTKTVHCGTKGGSNISIVPGLNRPLGKGVNANIDTNDFNGPNFKARPIKHWRRQLRPSTYAGTTASGRRNAFLSMVDAPGGTVYHNTSNCECDGSGNSYMISEKFNSQPTGASNGTIVENQGYVQVGTANSTDTDNNYQILTGIYQTKCITCGPETKVIRRANSNLSRAYYTTHEAYLRSRTNTYKQKLLTVPAPNVTYKDANGNMLWPSNALNGPQVYNTVDEYQPNSTRTCNGQKCGYTIFKPNNREYKVQGAVESSTRIDTLKQKTINKNAESLRASFGPEAVSATAFKGISDTPYFLKNKYQPPICSETNLGAIYRQDHTICFHTNSSDIQKRFNNVGFRL